MLKVRRMLYWRWPLPEVNLQKAIKLPPYCGAYTGEGHGRDNRDICSHLTSFRRSSEKLVLGRHSLKFRLPKILPLAFNQAPKKVPSLGIGFSEQNSAETFDVLSCDPGVHKAARFLSRSKRRSSGFPRRSSFNLPLTRRSTPGQVKRIYITSGYPSPVQNDGIYSSRSRKYSSRLRAA
jgi:hypothetical protein